MTQQFMTDPIKILVKRDELTLEVRLIVITHVRTVIWMMCVCVCVCVCVFYRAGRAGHCACQHMRAVGKREAGGATAVCTENRECIVCTLPCAGC
jgi:hypothetical protein